MFTRQARLFALACALLTGLWACTPQATPTSTATLAPPTATLTPVPPTITPTPSPTPLACLTEPGRLEQGSLQTSNPAQEYLIYLPPCYAQQTDLRYPVLYLLHGQTFTDDQWPRMGAVRIADQLILSGEAAPFIIVFPDDRYWNLPPGPGFGNRLIGNLIPYVDETYRTLADRQHRALGGLSRGGGWTVRLGLRNWELFGMLGLHSPVVFVSDAAYVDDWIAAIPSNSLPRLWLDIGDQDSKLGYARLLEETLSYYSVPHEWHQYSGDHSETYWSQHVEEYLRWYTAGWQVEP
jgi:enterochelin esterase-like enzyme